MKAGFGLGLLLVIVHTVACGGDTVKPAASCTDGIQNQDETGVDCGGTTCTACPPSCSDGLQNQGETAVDCGGPNCAACPPSCTDGIQNQGELQIDCGGANCAACPPTCSDGIQNQGEIRVDCGGPNCAACPPTCSDGIQNQGEIQIDCGGPNCGACPPPTCTDGYQNQGETKVDCGGPNCDPCPLTVPDLCALYYAAYQNTRDQDGKLYPTGYTPAVCTEAPIFDATGFDSATLAYRCRPGTDGYKWAQRLLAAVSEDRVTIDLDVATTCLETSRELRAGTPGIEVMTSVDWAALSAGACSTFYAGNVAANGVCKEDWDCIGDMGCYTTTPTVGGSRRCMAGGASGDDCTEWRPCAQGFYCNSGTCASAGGYGTDCYYEGAAACASGVCGPDSYCIDAPTKEIGDPCTEYEVGSAYSPECNIPTCGACRPLTDGAATTCQLLGRDGDYCRTWSDCAYDLGCQANVCTRSPAGDPCGPAYQSMCETGTVCIPSPLCDTYTAADTCDADPDCYWDTYYASCSAAGGLCVAEADLPETGACYGLGYCASHATCNDNNECVVLGGAGATCDVDHPCSDALGYACVGGLCTFACEVNEDCPANHYCDNVTGPSAVCLAINSSACDPGVDSCPVGQYCDLPGAECPWHAEVSTCNTDPQCAWAPGTCVRDHRGACAYYTTEPICAADTFDQCAWLPTANTCAEPLCSAGTSGACTALTGCAWLGGSAGACHPTCWLYANPTACHAANCAWSTSQGCTAPCAAATSQSLCTTAATAFGCLWEPPSCQTQFNCSQYDGDDTTCDNAVNCKLGLATTCARTSSATTGTCAAKLAVGALTLPDDGLNSSGTSRMCLSGYSMYDAGVSAEYYVCTEPPSASGCMDNEAVKQLIHLSFLFGFVWVLRRRRVRA